MERTVSAEEARTKAFQGVESPFEAGPGLVFQRYFTSPALHPYDEIQWEERTAAILNDRGEVVFEQVDVEVPRDWSQLATNVVVSKYFKGGLGQPGRETSVRQLIDRVVKTASLWGRTGGYFADEESCDAFRDELTYLLLNQYACFNSPVWFNMGAEPDKRPQVSACFINSVEDSMSSILDLAKTEGMLFKYGSGTGTNFSTLRGSEELLSTGGSASGPVSFMKGFDAFANVIKSGGKTRRAAKMVILDVDHPDIVEFIQSKAREELKAWSLIDSGYDGSVNGEAYSSVYFQNGNHSVRVSDEFMRAVSADSEWHTRARTSGESMGKFRARDVMRMISEAAHQCGDPGLQFDTTINDWHTCSGTDRIYASNPCVTGDTRVSTSKGWVRIDQMLEEPAEVVGADAGLHRIEPAFPTGTKPVYRLRTRAGFELTLTADHRVLTENRGDVPACELTKDDVLVLGRPVLGAESLDERLGEFLGLVVGDGCLAGEQQIATLTLSPEEEAVAARTHERLTAFKREMAADGRAARDIEVTNPQGTLRLATSARCVVDELTRLAILDEGSGRKAFRDEVFSLDRGSVAAVLRGLFTADGTVANYGEKSHYVALDSTSSELLSQVQLLLLSFGIKAKIYRDRRPLGQTMALLPDGAGGRKEYPVEQIHSLRVSRSSRVLFEREIGFVPGSTKGMALAALNREVGTYADRLDDRVESLDFVGEEPVFDLTERETHHFVANGLVVHNCSEYMFLNDTACNLASLNLMKFRDVDGEFDVHSFRHGVRTVFTAQEIFVDNASYPTPRIGENSHLFRPIGLGYANLGALLMARGLPYDSDSGRAYAAAVTSVMCGEAYRASAEIAARHGGPFARYEENRESFLKVMVKHRAAVEGINGNLVPGDLLETARQVWDEAVEIGREHGFRNAQATVLAPTGTIAFMMDCDTTGIEPDIALVKYKKLVGGGMLKIVNQTVREALARLGYSNSESEEIVRHVDSEETIEGALHLKPEHLPVFDCAFQATKGTRSIQYMGHVRMMAAVQPFLSGAISKTVNMPGTATVGEIEDAYTEAWRLGLKAIAIYRDGSKRIQPLGTSKEEKAKAREKEQKPVRRKLAVERQSLTHKFRVGEHKGYLTTGFYENGKPGEIFVTMAKEGSTVRGLMDTVATLVSICLQYGVPLEDLVRKFEYVKFEPQGITDTDGIRFAHSIVDYIFRWLGRKFLTVVDESVEEEVEEHGNGSGNGGKKENGNGGGEATTAADTGSRLMDALGRGVRLQTDAPACPKCGAIMVRNGACYGCLNCGTTSGCS